jgi:hypothetical protein
LVSSTKLVFCQFHFRYAHIDTTAHKNRHIITDHRITLDHNTHANKYAAATFAHMDMRVLITNGFMVPEALNTAHESNKNPIKMYQKDTTIK